MNKGHDNKQQKHPFQSQANKPQWPGQGHNPQEPKHNPGHNPQGNPNKPQWPGHKDKR